ncbi:MAG: SpoIID/LytB domain-containing protein [Acidimicrobiales bacterium]
MRVTLTFLVCFASAAVALVRPAQAATSPPSVSFSGHGYGHGRGMGQYGAYGYALMGQGYTAILAHYYGGTQLSTVDPNQLIAVHLSEYDGSAPVTVNGTTYTRPAADLTIPANRPETVSMPGAPTRTYQGSIVLKGGAQTGQVWNVVSLDDYAAGVVPAESIASWGADGGEAALQAQAVAARSYALAVVASDGAICDTTACQVYDGDPDIAGAPTNSPYTSYTDQAVTSTAGEILECGADAACGAPGQVALTEYSSSTGGYTAGGAFPPVPDAGDGYPGNGNPNHTWAISLPVSRIEGTFPSIGSLTGILVTRRNGLGDLGGRVEQLVVAGSAGDVTLSGAQFAADLGLDSDWFAVSGGIGTGASGGDNGYWIMGGGGSISAFGQAALYGSTAGVALNAPVVGMTATPDGRGYWLVAADGGVFSFGDARFYGSTGNIRLNQPIIGMTATPDGRGYWLYAADGGVFSFGDASFYGSTGNLRLNEPVVGMAASAAGGGYWLVAADGGVFSFGDAGFHGSMGGRPLNRPVVAMVRSAGGQGYNLVASDGGIFSFGDAQFVGSLPALGVSDDVVGVADTADGGGYLEVSRGGTVYSFGDAPYLGDMSTAAPGWIGPALGIVAHQGS